MNDNRNNAAPDNDLTDIAQPDSPANDGIDRRNFLSCMAWAGTGVLWTLAGGVPTSRLFAATKNGIDAPPKNAGSFSFVQISDSHIGFNKAANQDVTATLKLALNKIDAMHGSQTGAPDFMLHTGDITHSSKPAPENTTPPPTMAPSTASASARKPQAAAGTALTTRAFTSSDSTTALQIDAMGMLGPEQLAWLKKDLAPLSASTPIVVFAHIPLWMVYPDWGWGTQDGAEALSYLKRFGSVTVLNGHIHQIVQKVEGKVAFHTAASTAFPQPAPGKAANPGPMVVPPGHLKSVLGVTSVRFIPKQGHLAVVDSTLADNI